MINRHVSTVCKTCFFWLRQLRRVRRSLDTESVKTLVHAFVTSRVDYCNSFLSSAPKKVMDKLQHVQNAAARLVTGTRKYERGLLYADAWRPALAGYSPASAVQACCDSPSLSSAPSSRLPRRLLCASLWSSWSPASAICHTSSTVSSTSSTRHLWDPCFFCSRTNSLEFTARLSEGSSCRLRTI